MHACSALPTHKPHPDTPVDRLHPPAHIFASLLAPPDAAAQHEPTQTPTSNGRVCDRHTDPCASVDMCFSCKNTKHILVTTHKSTAPDEHRRLVTCDNVWLVKLCGHFSTVFWFVLK